MKNAKVIGSRCGLCGRYCSDPHFEYTPDSEFTQEECLLICNDCHHELQRISMSPQEIANEVA